MLVLGCLNNNNNAENNNLQNNSDSSYIPSNNSCDESLTQTEEIETTKLSSNNSANVSSGLDITMLLNISGRCAPNDAEMFVLPVGAKKTFLHVL